MCKPISAQVTFKVRQINTRKKIALSISSMQFFLKTIASTTCQQGLETIIKCKLIHCKFLYHTCFCITNRYKINAFVNAGRKLYFELAVYETFV